MMRIMTTTREQLLDAVRAAAFDGLLDDLTASEVARRAGVHRVTFYRHWPDVQKAVIDAFAQEVDRLATVEEAPVEAARTTSELASVYDTALLHSLEEVLAHRSVYRTLFAWPAFAQRMREMLRSRAALMIAAVERTGTPVPGAASGMAAEFVAGASVGVHAAWAASDATDARAAATDVIALMPAWWPRP
jgi:AcrR family transcriptional regulator